MGTTPPPPGSAKKASVRPEAGVMLSLDRVSRSYGPVLALAPLTLHLDAGTVCVVEGANGSGKTTLLRLAAGVLMPTGGRRRAFGTALYLRSGDGVRDAQTARMALDFAVGARGGDGNVEGLLDAVGLSHVADSPAATLSSGQRARVTLALAVAATVDVVCLDEPTAHLDTSGHAVARDLVQELARGGAAVLVATHDPQFLGRTADARICLRGGVAELAPW